MSVSYGGGRDDNGFDDSDQDDDRGRGRDDRRQPRRGQLGPASSPDGRGAASSGREYGGFYPGAPNGAFARGGGDDGFQRGPAYDGGPHGTRRHGTQHTGPSANAAAAGRGMPRSANGAVAAAAGAK